MKSQKGQSLVEFALILPVIVLFLFGIIDFGRIFYVYLTIDNTGRDTVRAASIGTIKTSDEIKQYAVNSFNNNISGLFKPLDKGNVSPPDDYSGSFFTVTSAGKNVGIKINYEVSIITPFLDQLFKGHPLTNTTKMRVE